MRRRAELDALRSELAKVRADLDGERAASQLAVAAIDRLRAAFDALDLGVVVVDAAGAEQLRNAEAARLIDARGAEAIAARALTDALERVRREPVAQIIELHGPPARTLALTASPLTDPSGAIGAVAVLQDVTLRYRLDAVRRDFVANVSHEMRTPIGAIVALADTLASEDDGQVMRRMAERIAREAERAGHLVDDLLDLSRIEGGEIERQEVVIAELIGDAVARVRSSARDRADDITVASDLPRSKVLVDASYVEVALVNLIENAVKYSEPGAPVVVDAVDDGEWFALSVRDHGIGIPPADRDRIFERFYRVDRARSRATGGTGLGLSIVRNVARNHGGDVYVESREGEGSTFVMRLPVAGSDHNAGRQP